MPPPVPSHGWSRTIVIASRAGWMRASTDCSLRGSGRAIESLGPPSASAFEAGAGSSLARSTIGVFCRRSTTRSTPTQAPISSRSTATTLAAKISRPRRRSRSKTAYTQVAATSAAKKAALPIRERVAISTITSITSRRRRRALGPSISSSASRRRSPQRRDSRRGARWPAISPQPAASARFR